MAEEIIKIKLCAENQIKYIIELLIEEKSVAWREACGRESGGSAGVTVSSISIDISLSSSSLRIGIASSYGALAPA
jgi:hypothetical protein